MKKFIYTLLVAVAPVILFAQNSAGINHINKVKKELINSKADTNRVLLIVDLCTAYQWTNVDSLTYYSKKGLELAGKLNFTRGEIRILNSLGISSSFHGNIPQALQVLFKALRLAEKNNCRLETAICLNSIGACYTFLGDGLKSIDFIKKAQSINETVKHAPRDRYWKIYIEFWLGTVYSDLNKPDSADIFLRKAYNDAFNPGFIDLYSIQPTIMMYYGKLYLRMGNHEKALDYLHRATATFEVYHDAFGTADVSTIIAQFFKAKNNPDSVIYYAKKGLDAAINFDYQSGIINNSKILAAQYENTDPKQELHYLKIEFAAKDSLYGAKKIQELQKTLSEEQQHQQQIEEEQLEKQNQLKQNGFLAGLGILFVIAFILFRNNRQRKKANILLKQQKDKLENTLSELKSTQVQLIHSEKMASLGELTAGIAHEIKNPLNFVNNFSEVSRELLNEMKIELQNNNEKEVSELIEDLNQNLEKINQHGKRADSIVKGMLLHSRGTSGEKSLTDINDLLDQYVNLTYHGMRAQNKDFNITIEKDFDETLEKINVVPQDISRVFLNVINNACYAAYEKKKKSNNNNFTPTLKVSTKQLDGKIEIRIGDNGNGIPKDIIDKIFQPFFTTKPTGEGTGLGLSLSYDIVTKVHGGELKVDSKQGNGTEFIIVLLK